MFSSSRSIWWTSISIGVGGGAGGRVTGDVCLCSPMLVLKQLESMLLLYLMTSHKLWLRSHILWLFTAILEVTNCVCSGYGGGYWIWKHKICLDTGGNIGGWIQIVTNWGEMHIPCPNSLEPSRYHLVSTTNTHRVQLVVWPQCSTDYNVDIV